MKKKLLCAVVTACTFATAAFAANPAAGNPMVGGKEMFPNKDIIDNAVNSADHTTLVAAVKAADLVATLKGAGPFTVFAPTNEAFAKLPAGTVDSLLKPENKATLTKILTYHVVAGKMSSLDLKNAIKAGNGTAALKTVSRRHALGDGEGRQDLAQGREGRHVHGDDRQRLPVQRRHPRRRHRRPAELTSLLRRQTRGHL